MSRKRDTKRAEAALLASNGAEIRALQYRFEWEKEQWEKTHAALQREAFARGLCLVTICEETQIGDGGLLIVSAQSLSHHFERVPTVPKSKRAACGAKTRAGGACRATVCLKANGRPAKRCRLHGGKSTGAKTAAGKAAQRAAIIASNRRRARTNVENC